MEFPLVNVILAVNSTLFLNSYLHLLPQSVAYPVTAEAGGTWGDHQGEGRVYKMRDIERQWGQGDNVRGDWVVVVGGRGEIWIVHISRLTLIPSFPSRHARSEEETH